MLCCTCFACGDGGLVTRVKADRLIDWLRTNWKCVCACRYICSFYSLYSLQICNSPFVITSFSHTQQGWFSSEMTKKRSQKWVTLNWHCSTIEGHYTAGFCSINPGVQSLSAARGLGPSTNRRHWPWSSVTENKPVAWNLGNWSLCYQSEDRLPPNEPLFLAEFGHYCSRCSATIVWGPVVL